MWLCEILQKIDNSLIYYDYKNDYNPFFMVKKDVGNCMGYALRAIGLDRFGCSWHNKRPYCCCALAQT